MAAKEVTRPIDADDTACLIARKFCELLHDAIGTVGVGKAVRLNAEEEDDNVCHTHDFCDANQVMLDAFEEMGIIDATTMRGEMYDLLTEQMHIDPHVADQITDKMAEHHLFGHHLDGLWTIAWDIAQEAEFQADKCKPEED